jgi:histidinol-phosphate aminotransferase
VTRTFSKAYGLAGLRIGVLLGDPDHLRSIRLVSSPYSVNGVALACLPDALADQGFIRQYVSEVSEGRERLQESLRSHGIPFWPSHANFVLAQIGSPEFIPKMRQRGILVRDRSSDHRCKGCVRITIGPRTHTDRLLTALEETLQELAIAPGVSKL